MLAVSPCTSADDYLALVNSPAFTTRWMLERHLAARHQSLRSFSVPGFCTTCKQAVDFAASFEGAWQAPDGLRVPNWREVLRCPSCRLSGRQRRVIELVTEALADHADRGSPRMYLMEAVSPIHDWLRATFPWLELVASEYLGPDVARGATQRGIRNEDAERLTLADDSIDLFVSCDVFEHVNDPARAFAEVARTLRIGGRAILTFPMDPNLAQNRRRAALANGSVETLLPAIYHGNPLSRAGSLVFTDFGWEVLGQLRAAGLGDAALHVYWSYLYGYLGIQFYFAAHKR